jgi:hypothetical protein
MFSHFSIILGRMGQGAALAHIFFKIYGLSQSTINMPLKFASLFFLLWASIELKI